MIISSSYQTEHAQTDGRMWVTETHLTDSGENKINAYLASPNTDYEAAMKAHAELVDAQPEITEEDVLDAELVRISVRLDEISEAYPQKVKESISVMADQVSDKLALVGNIEEEIVRK